MKVSTTLWTARSTKPIRRATWWGQRFCLELHCQVKLLKTVSDGLKLYVFTAILWTNNFLFLVAKKKKMGLDGKFWTLSITVTDKNICEEGQSFGTPCTAVYWPRFCDGRFSDLQPVEHHVEHWLRPLAGCFSIDAMICNRLNLFQDENFIPSTPHPPTPALRILCFFMASCWK